MCPFDFAHDGDERDTSSLLCSECLCLLYFSPARKRNKKVLRCFPPVKEPIQFNYLLSLGRYVAVAQDVNRLFRMDPRRNAFVFDMVKRLNRLDEFKVAGKQRRGLGCEHIVELRELGNREY
jgi:hypothetical protein